MAFVDLHVHSNNSDDAEFSVRDIIDKCKEKNMKRIAITDHNSVKGVCEAIELGKKAGIEVYSGIEIDCADNDGKNYHLLGYMIDYKRSEFLEIERDIFQKENNASVERIAKLKKYTGVPFDEQEIYDRAKGKIITGELIANVILNKENAGEYDSLKPFLPGGSRSDRPYVNFYWDFFAQGCPAFVEVDFISLKNAIKLVKDAGGVPVLAHPGQNIKDDFTRIDSIIDLGICGIEAFSTYHTAEVSEFYYRKAVDNKLLVTCGSDFHGKNKPDIEIGDCKLTIDEDMIFKIGQ